MIRGMQVAVETGAGVAPASGRGVIAVMAMALVMAPKKSGDDGLEVAFTGSLDSLFRRPHGLCYLLLSSLSRLEDLEALKVAGEH